jgi:hypothetical protein
MRTKTWREEANTRDTAAFTTINIFPVCASYCGAPECILLFPIEVKPKGVWAEPSLGRPGEVY